MTGIDTNSLIYAYDKRDPVKQLCATQLINGTADGVVMWQVACEFIHASRKLANQGFTPDDAWNHLEELLSLFPLVVPVEPVDCLKRARELQLDLGWSFWDANLVAACLNAGVTRLFTEDLPGGPAPDGLEIINPFA